MTDKTPGTALATTDETIPALARPRLPYHPAIEERFGVDRGTWKVLTDNIFPTAEAPESIIAVLSYCRARRLDVLKKPVHIVQVWDKAKQKMVDTFWPSINELRITAMRTGEYVGKEATEFGPLRSEKVGSVEMEFPEWAQTTVYRHVKGQPRAFVGERVLWLEYYAKVKRDDKTPNEMWRTKAHSQISKCSEASALRTAFPEELGNDRASEEMEGQEVDHVEPMVSELSSGVGSRLNGNQDAPGFSQAAVHAEDGGKKPSRSRKAKETAQDEARPTGTGSVPTVAAEPDTSASADPASSTSQEATSGQESSGTGSAQDAEFTPVKDHPTREEIAERLEQLVPDEVTSDGYPEAGEVYMLEGDTWNEEGRRDTYKDGLPFSTTGGESDLFIYADHAPGEDGPLTPEARVQAERAQEGQQRAQEHIAELDEQGDDFPPEFKTYIETVESAADWVTVKKAMADFYTTALFKSWTLAAQNKVRASTWEIIQENKIPGVPDQAQDVSAFRLWIEVQEDPEAIKGTFAVLQREPAYANKDDAFKQAMATNVQNRLAAL